MTTNTNQIVTKYVELRDARAALKADYDARDKQIKDQMEVIETYLMTMMQELGIDSVKTDAGTAYRSTRVKASIADRELARQFVLSSRNLDLLELRASSAGVKQYLQENGSNPPGFETLTEETVNVRRS